MFNVALHHHGARNKYVPGTRPQDSTLIVQTVCVNDKRPGTGTGSWPPPGAQKRISKANRGAVAVRHPSPRSPSLETLEAAWGEMTDPERVRTPQSSPKNEHQRGRKKGFRPPDVRTIFSPEKDPRVRQESGEGHSFEPREENTWCDVCCHYIFRQGLTCTGCKYACHAECRDKVSLDCLSASQDQINNNHTPSHDVEKERELRTEFSRDEIRLKIDQYNAMTKDHLKMTLNASGVYTGFIKVQMDLRRPVTVRGGNRGDEAFYLPRGVTNTLHISSMNTVGQVIVALLGKFTVADNPAKYALYKRYRREEQVYVCKLAEGEQPLFLRLVAGPDTDGLSFVLRERQTGEVMWDAFSIPELRNFLRILQKEEDEQREAVFRRYQAYRHRLQAALTDAATTPS